MNVEDVTALILSLPNAVRSANTDTPDFRVAGKIFATLPSDRYLVLRLTPEQQVMAMRSDPHLFSPVEGGWGERGWTNVALGQLDQTSALSALIIAWGNTAPESGNRVSADVRAGARRDRR